MTAESRKNRCFFGYSDHYMKIDRPKLKEMQKNLQATGEAETFSVEKHQPEQSTTMAASLAAVASSFLTNNPPVNIHNQLNRDQKVSACRNLGKTTSWKTILQSWNCRQPDLHEMLLGGSDCPVSGVS